MPGTAPKFKKFKTSGNISRRTDVDNSHTRNSRDVDSRQNYINRRADSSLRDNWNHIWDGSNSSDANNSRDVRNLETPLLERMYKAKSLLVTSLLVLSKTTVTVTSNEITILFSALQIYSHARISKEMLSTLMFHLIYIV